MTVVDASVYVAVVHSGDVHHERARAWFRKAVLSGDLLRAPVVLVAETGAAISRGLAEPELAREAIRQLWEQKLIELVPVSRKLSEDAAEIAVESRIRGCDAIYVALAGAFNDRLCTLDRQQLERGASLVETLRP